ncbi:aspartyl-phosphate phosphatase Spo0E family protein [Alteribacter natronophilus]|uniref:aspartyl-phosphate phosphatase Spo0E family protein n=1 Tax=Alteribacter natronophilus TaxID=2583810 RepID=UPI001486CDDA|nr:aspartyl-phosphate phosphatase Spo0E family protein [Alteribacter natronophilus]
MFNHVQHIEEKRKELLLTAENCGFNAAETLLCSKELDELIIRYQRTRYSTASCV